MQLFTLIENKNFIVYNNIYKQIEIIGVVYFIEKLLQLSDLASKCTTVLFLKELLALLQKA